MVVFKVLFCKRKAETENLVEQVGRHHRAIRTDLHTSKPLKIGNVIVAVIGTYYSALTLCMDSMMRSNKLCVLVHVKL